MGETTAIAWCDATVNPWWGCTKIADECSRCYAADLSHRYGRAEWGDKAERWIRIDAAIKELRKLAKQPTPPKVFMGSMCDILEDRPELDAPRSLLFEAVDELAGRVVALFLSKRIGNAERMMPAHWRTSPPPFVWWGTSIGHKKREEEAASLIATPAAVRFISAEPLLTFVSPWPWWGPGPTVTHPDDDAPDGAVVDGMERVGSRWERRAGIDWVIIGGESGPKHREMSIVAAEKLAAEALDNGAAVFVKQDSGHHPGRQGRLSDAMWALKQFPSVRA